jgi:hypothetical protein
MPPKGCHYENARPGGACDDVTCGHLVCTRVQADDSLNDAGEDAD